MKIFVKAKPSAKKQNIEKIDDSHFVISVKEPPVQGLANKAVLKNLADYFGIPQENVRIISGFTSRQKIVEIKNK